MSALATEIEAEARPRSVARSQLVEFLVVGGATLFLFPLSFFLRHVLRLEDAELAFGFTTFWAAYVINDPHFTVTYLLFYKDVRKRAFGSETPRAQRLRFVVCGFAVPALLVAWSVVGISLHSAQTIGWMVQLMFLLVGWHYVKQGFGVLAVLSARRGVVMTSRERMVVLFHCFAGWAFAWANPAIPARDFEEKGVVYRALAHPRWLEILAGSVLAVSTIALLHVLIARWRREGRTLPLAPLFGLLVTIWSWTIFSSFDPLVRYVIPALHAVQYFYFVWLMKANEARAEEGPPLFGRPVAVRLGILALSALGLGFLLFRGIPTFLDTAFVPHPRGGTDDPMGETPFFCIFFVVVNIHHYFMDHVVWRRENPDTRWLRSTA